MFVECINLKHYEQLDAYNENAYVELVKKFKDISKGDKLIELIDGDDIVCYLIPPKIVQLLVTQYVAKELITVEINSDDLSDK